MAVNGIKYSVTPQSEALKKGNYWIATNDVPKPYNTDWYTALTPATGGYSIYVNKASGGPSIFQANNDSDLIYWTRSLSGQTFVTGASALNWYNTQTDKMVFNIDYPPVITNGLVLSLDAGFTPSYPKGSNAWYDLGPNGTNGTLVNSPMFSSDEGGSISFDGADDYVNCGNILNYTSQNFTFSCWIYFNSLTTSVAGQGPVVFNKGAFQTNGYYNQISTNGRSLFVTNQSGAFQRSETPIGTININKWYNLAFVRNGSSVRVYVNGADLTQNAGTHINPQSSSGNFLIAVYPFSFYGNFILSQFLNYDRALTPSEVLQNYQAMLPRFVGENIVTNGMVHYLDAGFPNSYGGTGTTWTNVAGTSGGDGTLVNGPTYSPLNGGSIVYDGTDDYVSVSDQTYLQIAGQITLGSWFKLSPGATGQPTIIIKEVYNSATNNSGYILRNTRFNNSVYIALFNDSVNAAGTPTNSIALDTWYYACGTYDGSQIKMYLNGTLQATTNYSGGIKTNSSTLFIVSPLQDIE